MVYLFWIVAKLIGLGLLNIEGLAIEGDIVVWRVNGERASILKANRYDPSQGQATP